MRRGDPRHIERFYCEYDKAYLASISLCGQLVIEMRETEIFDVALRFLALSFFYRNEGNSLPSHLCPRDFVYHMPGTSMASAV